MPYVVLVHGDTEMACWPLPAGQSPDLLVVDQLARLRLAAHRLGWSIRLRDAPSRLRELIDLVGLSDIVTDVAGLATGETGVPTGEPDGGNAADA